MKEQILFKSNRNIDYFLLSIIFLLIIFILWALSFSISIINKTNKVDNEKLNIENNGVKVNEKGNIVITDDSLKRILNKDTILTKQLSEVFQKAHENQYREDNRVEVFHLIFVDIMLLLFLFFLIKFLVNNFYKYRVSFLITKDYMIIQRLRKNEKISLKNVVSITLLGKINETGYLYNRDLNAIIIKTNNKQDSYILADIHSYQNLCNLAHLLRELIPEKIIIKKVKVDKVKRSYMMLFSILLTVYILLKMCFSYGIYFVVAVIVFGFIIDAIKKSKINKVTCPELFET